MALAILNHTSTSVETPTHNPPEEPAKPPMPERRDGFAARWSKKDTLLLLAILLLAGSLRVLRLAEPNAVVFDETYYAKDACLYLGHSQEFCNVDQATEQSYVHPPLGKWLISLGISAFGYNSFGWRFSAAIFGTAMAVLVFLLARKLFRDRWIAAVAGLLTAVDLLLIVQSRIAMLDIFLGFFVLLGFWFLALDRERALRLREGMASVSPPAHLARTQATGEPGGATRADESNGTLGSEDPNPVKASGEPNGAMGSLQSAASEEGQPPNSPSRDLPETDLPARGVRWRFAAGAAFGLAFAVKWSALLALGAAAVCALFWSLELLVLARKHRSSFYGPPRGASLGREIVVSFAAFLLVPAIVYLGAYGPYFLDRHREDCPYTVTAEPRRLFDSDLLGEPEGKCITGVAGTALSFGDLQDRIFDYHSSLNAKHGYQSKAWTWPLLLRPVAYFYESNDGKATEVMALGNVAVWYGALLALFWLIPRSLKRWSAERLVLLAWGAQYLPWLLVPRPLFLFYMTPAVPFMMVGLACALGAVRRSGAFGRALVFVYLILGAGLITALFYPVVAGVPLPQEWWERLMWIQHFDCGSLKCGWI